MSPRTPAHRLEDPVADERTLVLCKPDAVAPIGYSLMKFKAFARQKVAN